MTELSYIVHLILCSGVASKGALGHVPLLDSAKNVRPVTRPASIDELVMQCFETSLYVACAVTDVIN